jgi:hypothetical protein
VYYLKQCEQEICDTFLKCHSGGPLSAPEKFRNEWGG